MAPYAAIFDMDGVLIDSYQAHFASWQRMLATHGLTISEKDFARTFGQTNVAIISQFWPDKAADRDVMAAMADEKEQAFREVLREHFPEMPGASDLLRALHQAGWLLAVGSSGPRENVQTVLNCLPAGGLFHAAVTGCDVSHSKPHPEVFLTAAGKLGAKPECCVVIEDAPVGLQAAHAAGMAAVALTGTFDRAAHTGRADSIVDSLTELTPGQLAELIDRR